MVIQNYDPLLLPPRMEAKLWAKSPDKGGESLAQHTWDVLARLADQIRLRPSLPDQLGEPRLWTRLYWACFLHDFGKAASGFQQVLRGEIPRWPYRHEVLSLPFVEWVFSPEHPDYPFVVAAVASHHKDFDVIQARYIHKSEDTLDTLETILSQVDGETLEMLWQWLSTCGSDWAERLGLAALVEIPPVIAWEEARQRIGLKSLQRALVRYGKWVYALEDRAIPAQEMIAALHLRGLIQTADHAASGHSQSFPTLALSRQQALGGVSEVKLKWHQRTAGKTGAESVILIAPTGSGKTEAALLWAAHQLEQAQDRPARLFYVLPYQASMNAMWLRLNERHFQDATEDQVGLQHGRALQGVYYDLIRRMEEEDNPDSKRQQARDQANLALNLAHLYYYPVRIFSPYEMLKAAYRLKGFETQLVDYHNGLFIVDEIHAYEPCRLALIVSLIKRLARDYRARFLIMTATLPPMIEAVLKEALPGCETICADAQTFQDSRRHIVKLVEGDLLEEPGRARIEAAVAAGQRVLVCLNTVRRAKEAAEHFKHLDVEQVIVHGRFNAEDRKQKEADIIAHAGVKQGDAAPLLVIATQVVEVSLDIDMDVLFTDPAPLEALLQRFGRVNRGHPAGASLKNVYVFRQPEDVKVYKPVSLVQGALDELSRIDGHPVDEEQVTDMLRRVYAGQSEAEWHKEYHRAAQDFEMSILDNLRPFQSADPAIARKFYELFDGVEVLPQCREDDFNRRLREDKNYIEATSLLVPIRWGQYMEMHNSLKCTVTDPFDDTWPKVVDVPYTSETGLDIEAVRRTSRRK